MTHNNNNHPRPFHFLINSSPATSNSRDSPVTGSLASRESSEDDTLQPPCAKKASSPRSVGYAVKLSPFPTNSTTFVTGTRRRLTNPMPLRNSTLSLGTVQSVDDGDADFSDGEQTSKPSTPVQKQQRNTTATEQSLHRTFSLHDAAVETSSSVTARHAILDKPTLRRWDSGEYYKAPVDDRQSLSPQTHVEAFDSSRRTLSSKPSTLSIVSIMQEADSPAPVPAGAATTARTSLSKFAPHRPRSSSSSAMLPQPKTYSFQDLLVGQSHHEPVRKAVMEKPELKRWDSGEFYGSTPDVRSQLDSNDPGSAFDFVPMQERRNVRRSSLAGSEEFGFYQHVEDHGEDLWSDEDGDELPTHPAGRQLRPVMSMQDLRLESNPHEVVKHAVMDKPQHKRWDSGEFYSSPVDVREKLAKNETDAVPLRPLTMTRQNRASSFRSEDDRASIGSGSISLQDRGRAFSHEDLLVVDSQYAPPTVRNAILERPRHKRWDSGEFFQAPMEDRPRLGSNEDIHMTLASPPPAQVVVGDTLQPSPTTTTTTNQTLSKIGLGIFRLAHHHHQPTLQRRSSSLAMETRPRENVVRNLPKDVWAIVFSFFTQREACSVASTCWIFELSCLNLFVNEGKGMRGLLLPRSLRKSPQMMEVDAVAFSNRRSTTELAFLQQYDVAACCDVREAVDRTSPMSHNLLYFIGNGGSGGSSGGITRHILAGIRNKPDRLGIWRISETKQSTTLLRTLNCHGPVSSCSVTPAGLNTLASVTTDGVVCVFKDDDHSASYMTQIPAPTAPANGWQPLVTCAQDYSLISWSNTFHCLDMETGAFRRSMSCLPSNVLSSTIVNHSFAIFGFADGSVALWDARAAKLENVAEASIHYNSFLSLRGVGNIAIAASPRGGISVALPNRPWEILRRPGPSIPRSGGARAGGGVTALACHDVVLAVAESRNLFDNLFSFDLRRPATPMATSADVRKISQLMMDSSKIYACTAAGEAIHVSNYTFDSEFVELRRYDANAMGAHRTMQSNFMALAPDEAACAFSYWNRCVRISFLRSMAHDHRLPSPHDDERDGEMSTPAIESTIVWNKLGGGGTLEHHRHDEMKHRIVEGDGHRSHKKDSGEKHIAKRTVGERLLEEARRDAD